MKSPLEIAREQEQAEERMAELTSLPNWREEVIQEWSGFLWRGMAVGAISYDCEQSKDERGEAEECLVLFVMFQ